MGWTKYKAGDDALHYDVPAITLDALASQLKKTLGTRGGIIVLCHGGPFDEPDAVAQALARLPGVAGFFGASSIERLPTERAIRSQVEHFKGLKLNREPTR